MTYGLNVTYTMKPGKRADYLAALEAQGIPAAVRGEEGCLQYDYFLDVQQPDRLLLVERWTHPQAQQTHLKQPHMAQAAALKPEYVVDTRVIAYGVE